jgi:flavorubredoxin
MRVEHLYSKNNHSFTVIGRDEDRRKEVIDTNQYLIQSNGRGLILDPGGVENFAVVAAEFSKHFDLSNLEAIFASHQDPDVISSLPFWIQSNPDLKVYIPEIWSGFITHFGIKPENLCLVPDQGGEIILGDAKLELIPAHYLHSSGNLSLYDPQAKILFSGDIGAALIPGTQSDLFVDDFDQHVTYMEYFHKRWMASNNAKANWIAEVRNRDVEMICPQHGAIFKGENVDKFLGWFERFEVGKWK